ncbi:MAG: hypothetical protein HYX68_04620 [Planctomycetes bacterium]|nr:hypothetical protein [Planctomycetota bacterium]
MVQLSIREHSRREIDRHKWLASQRAGCDLGEVAVKEWITLHWSGYWRARCMEHLQGKAYWTELKGDDFGILEDRFQHRALLADRIADRLKAGQENLDIIQWALNWHIDMDAVLDILATLDINNKRMGYPFGS